MLQAGLTLIEALEIQENTAYIRDELKLGKKFSQIMQDLKVKENLISFIKIGEMTGNLAKVCFSLSKDIKDKSELKSKVVFSLMYPGLIGFMSLAMCIFLITYIFPKVLPVFSSMKVKLPMSTKLLIFLSDFIRENWIYIILFLILTPIILFFLHLKFERLQKLVLINPVKYIKASLHMKTLAMFSESGISLEIALQEIIKLEKNTIYKRCLASMHSKVINGISLSKVLEENGDLYPLKIHHLIKAGEHSGKLKEMLNSVCELYENKLNSYLKITTSFMEPVIMIVMGGIIGFIALSIISPLYSFTSK